MSRARKISSDLRHVATLAGTTAAVVEGAAIAAERARSVADHLGTDREQESAPVAELEVVTRTCRGRRTLMVLVVVGLLAAVGGVVWKKRRSTEDEIADLRDDRFAGSMP